MDNRTGLTTVSAVIGISLAILAVFVLIKVVALLAKIVAVIVLIGAAIFGYLWIQRRVEGRRR